ncbi:hypothetical protein C9374_003440 [Naegleria lovaniensis]|uniref:Uncharacterized protein n=1 Tax=Naegleria lovaniensis TaxID=51637 RepID=A0AA88GMX1_NAELO|nr:uncharacterized protein C9374_003440 [Naegleria lovaniensis]KAG2385625.1 hypothetical protein C9374_003440 [Naegleria lovaniensis]
MQISHRKIRQKNHDSENTNHHEHTNSDNQKSEENLNIITTYEKWINRGLYGIVIIIVLSLSAFIYYMYYVSSALTNASPRYKHH